MRILLTITLSLIMHALYGQHDKIYLVDGDILTGNVTNVRDHVIKFNLRNAGEIEVAVDKIIGHKAIGYRKGEGIFKHLSDSLNTKYQSGPRLQIGLGLIHDDSQQSADLNGTVNIDVTYRFAQYLQFGWGFGYNRYELVRSIPVYFTYLGDLTFNKAEGPYYFFNIGKSTAWGNDECNCEAGSGKDGLYLSGGLGYRWDFNGKSFFIQSGWLQERITTTFSSENVWGIESRLWGPNNNSTILRQKLNSVNLIIGIKF